MVMTRHDRLASLAGVTVLAISVLLLVVQKAAAQQNSTEAKADAKKTQPIKIEPRGLRGAAGDEMGPPQRPRRLSAGAKRPPGKPPGRKAKVRGIPAPTVVLKPGEVPDIKFDAPIYNFGGIRAGPDVVHEFWFTNTGTGPLEILKVRPG